MAFNTPGVFVEEQAPQLTPLITAGTGVAAFIGFSTRGPTQKACILDSYEDLLRIFGSGYENESTFNSIRMFFENGGSRAYFVRLSDIDTSTGAEIADAASTEVTTASDSTGKLVIKAGYRGYESVGLEGNQLFVKLVENPKHPTVGRGSDLITEATTGSDVIQLAGLVGIQAGSLLKFDTTDANADATAGDNAVKYYVVRRVETRLEAGVIKHFAYLTKNLAETYTIASTAISSVEYDVEVYSSTNELLESWPQLSLSVDADNNMLATINDTELGSRYLTMTYTPLAVDDGALLATETIIGSAVQLASGTSENVGATVAMFTGDESLSTGIHALDPITEINMVCVPPTLSPSTNAWSVQGTAAYHAVILEYVESRMDVFALLDPAVNLGINEVKNYREQNLGVDSAYGALFYPFIKIQDPQRPNSSATILVPPSGAVAGAYARVDSQAAPDGGVSSAAAGVGVNGAVRNAIGLERLVSDKEQAILNPAGINCIRLLSRASGGQGIFIFGARTLSTEAHMRYIPMRRTLTYIEETIRLSSQFAIFKKNGPALWSRLDLLIDGFLRDMWADGELKGATPREAYFVQIDSTTTTSIDIENGVIRGKIGVSLFRPAEFIVFTFTQAQSGSSIEEI